MQNPGIQEKYAYTVSPGHYTVLCLCIQFSFVIKILCREVAEEKKEGKKEKKTRNKKESIATIQERIGTRWDESFYFLSIAIKKPYK